MAVRVVDKPDDDLDWATLVDRHPAASVFHSPGWLRALRLTYGYEPFVATTSGSNAITNGVVACRVSGWTSRRLVSLPFSDHCDPLVDGPGELAEILTFLLADAQRDSSSVEMRPARTAEESSQAAIARGLGPAARYFLHRVDLRHCEADLFAGFHHSTQRAVRRAEREGLTHESGASQSLLDRFYPLLRMTRRRHGLPPQPLSWFRNLLVTLGDSVAIHVAMKNGQPVAGVLTLWFKKTLYYKYGGSDAAHHRLGGMPFLFWRVIQDARIRGFEELDLGRSDFDQPGLITFKDHLGGAQSPLTYYRYPRQRAANRAGWARRVAGRTFAYLPDAALDLTGKLLYKRLG